MRTLLNFPWKNPHLRTTSSEKHKSRRRSLVGISPERLEERSLLSTGLVAAYSFSAGSGSVLADVSGNGNNGTIANATWTTSGKYGDALVFNGTNARVNINDSASLHLTTGMTLEAWVNPSTLNSNWRDVIYKGNDNYWLEATSTSGSKPAAGATLGSSDVDTLGTAALTTNTWAFLTKTYNGSTLALYVNGTLVSSLAHTGNIATSTNPLQIGGDSIYGQYFQGMIDNVRIYNSALTQAQIQTDMTTAVTSAAPVVTGETPASGATGVATNTGVTATFNEAVQASSITTTTFTLKNSSGTAVAGTVAYNSSTNTATLTPSAALAYSTTYTATVSAAKSTSGTAMTAPMNWSFTTAAAAPTAPVVTSTTPASGATGVPVNTTVTGTFSKAVQASTISFALKNSAGTTVPSSVSYNSSNSVVTLTPSAALAYSTTYTATLSRAKDSAGNTMTSTSWSFATAAPVVATGTTYYVSPSTTSGSGTLSNPFGLTQLLNTTTTPVSQGPALKILKPGDTLYFLGGTYTVSGSTSANYWWTQLISPTVSGTASEPITLAAYPGATVNFVMSAGAQPLFGTTTPTLNYVRFLGFTIQPLSTYGGGGEVADAFSISGTGNEVGYCTIIGQYQDVTDNYQGIWLTGADSTWIHNNDIYGFTGPSQNDSGIKLYGCYRHDGRRQLHLR